MYEIFLKIINEKGLKPSDVAKATGIPENAFSYWKTGRSKPKSDRLQKIADFLGVSLEYLRTGKDNRVPIPTFEPEMIELITCYSKLNTKNKKVIMDLARALCDNE